jgi:hypothetical protein
VRWPKLSSGKLWSVPTLPRVDDCEFLGINSRAPCRHTESNPCPKGAASCL